MQTTVFKTYILFQHNKFLEILSIDYHLFQQYILRISLMVLTFPISNYATTSTLFFVDLDDRLSATMFV